MRNVNLPILKLSLMVFFAITLGQLTNAQVQQRLCDKYEAIQSDNGLYTVNNNIWGSDASQCIDYYGGAGFVVAHSDLNNPDGNVASYPFLGAGCHWGNCSNEGYGLPIAANQICSAPVHYKVNTYRPWGQYNVMIEGWLLPPGMTTDNGYAGGCEILIGLDYVGGMGPCGSSYGNFMGYEMYWCDWAGWNFVQFVKTGTSVADIDFKDFLNKTIEMGWCGADWELHNMQAGFEIVRGGTGLATEEFTFSIETGTNCGPPTGCDNAQATYVSNSGATRIEAENYCQADDVQTEPCSEGGENVGYINPGSWMAYKLDIAQAGEYTVRYRVASLSSGGDLKFEAQGGTPLYGTKSFTASSGWQNWKTVEHTVNLNAGIQNVAIAATTGGWNINWFELEPKGQGNDYTLTVNTSGNGSVTKNPDMASYPAGTPVTLTAIPGSGDSFLGWSGDQSGTTNPVTIIMDGNKTISAAFSNNGGGDCTSISLPFTFEGTGSKCWETTDELGTINSWSLDKLTINGVDYTNAWANGGYPAKINGKYKIEFESTIAWGHFEASGNKSAGEDFRVTEFTIYPNPATDQLFVEVANLESDASLVVFDMTGKQLVNQPVYDSQMIIDISSLESGMYMIKVNNTQKRFIKQ